MLNKMFISDGVFLALLCKKKPSEMVFSVLPLVHAQPGSLALKQIGGWRKGASVEQGEDQHLPTALLQRSWGEQGQRGGRSIPSWRRRTHPPPPLRNVARGGEAGAGRRVATSLALQEKYQPRSPRGRSRSGLCTARFMGPSRLEKIQ